MGLWDSLINWLCRYFWDFEVETIGLKETPRSCSSDGCGARLKDTAVDWEDALPPKELNPAEKHCKVADAVLCLGTSLQITPACNLPLKSLRGWGKFVIASLQVKPLKKPLIYHRYKEAMVCNRRKYLLSCPFLPPPISCRYSVAIATICGSFVTFETVAKSPIFSSVNFLFPFVYMY
ncbi:NAD-dependent protein deacetylase SRT1-like isoform X3 [Camellia sinensis]|uniref:NAD-dependent protein deacetylase SRT1-like isoform X3 n=1 Tax=Camellia sinensis TaxID=4442 RepID=UPI0010359B42|nr:NAD-dependent protein deacetylase SRT1-like isoform X3 [Camellia sinensis]